MAHKPYNLYKRATTRNNKYIYYCQFYDESGNRMTAMSTGQTSKTAAEIWAIEQLKKGIITTNKNITFAQYAQDWWLWEKCKYVKGKRVRGSDISRDYVDSMRSYLQNHILLEFGNKKLQKITTKMIENWILKLREKPSKFGQFLTATTVNHCLKTFKIMLKEAKRLGYLQNDPAESVKRLKETPKTRDIFTINEIRELFTDDNIKKVWDGDLVHFCLNLLSASTGMRMGEIQALMIKHLHKNYVGIFHGWSRKYGLKNPKWRSEREIPIPSKTSAYLQELISISPYRDADDCAPRAYMKIYMCGATHEMRVGPSEPTCRSRLQTASSCAG